MLFNKPLLNLLWNIFLISSMEILSVSEIILEIFNLPKRRLASEIVGILNLILPGNQQLKKTDWQSPDKLKNQSMIKSDHKIENLSRSPSQKIGVESNGLEPTNLRKTPLKGSKR